MLPWLPSCAIAMGSRASVTVSIAAETIGMLIWMLRETRARRETSRGRTVEWSGTSRTSSKVSALVITRMPIVRAAKRHYTRGVAAGKTAGYRSRRRLTPPPKGSMVSPLPNEDNVMKTPVRLVLLLGATLIAALPAAAQQLYKYTGPDGKVQYSDRPPPDGRKAEKVTSSRLSSGPSTPVAAANTD